MSSLVGNNFEVQQTRMKKLPALILFCCFTLLGPIGYAQCLPSAQTVLHVNNVSAPIDNDGSIGFSQLSPMSGYTIETESGSVSAGMAQALWVGGEVLGQPYVAAMRHGTVGNDYFPGPLSTNNASTNPQVCAEYNKIWSIDKWRVQEFIARLGQPGYVVPDEILDWPAHGDVNESLPYYLAPFYDADFDGAYMPEFGDYPYFDLDPEPFTGVVRRLRGDRSLFWVINDVGTGHTETGGPSIGLEVRCIAYAFDRCGPLGDVTFYVYQIINRGNHTLENAYIGLWADMDIENLNDDYVRCDVGRSLGYTYNANANDQYTAVGLDLLSGPYQDPDGQDNDSDGITDNETFGMTRFLVQNNINGGYHPDQNDPNDDDEYYENLKGHWLNGSPVCYGATGHGSGGCDVSTQAAFMFPGSSDPTGIGTGGQLQLPWTEESANTTPYDRRFLISSGPFTLLPGSVNDIHFAVLAAHDPTGQDVFSKIAEVDDFVQAAFDSGFAGLPCCPPKADIYLSQVSSDEYFFSSITEADDYYWDFGDGTTSTDRFPDLHSFPDEQLYEVTLIVSNNCGADTVSVFALPTIGVEEYSSLDIKLFPNPTNSTITLQTETPLSQAWLTDLAGRKLMLLQPNGTQWQADLSTLPHGMYLVEVFTEEGKRGVRKVVRE